VASLKGWAPPAGAHPIPIVKGGPGTADPGQITWSNLPMRAILLRAYGIRNYQLVTPKWVDTERYDIAARIPLGSTVEQFRAMLRNLLKQRFQLAAREETREGPLYALLAGKNGARPRLRKRPRRRRNRASAFTGRMASQRCLPVRVCGRSY
jgi:uncharacterized protein (TIGR03435 family)